MMEIKSNFNLESITERDCLYVEIESNDSGDWYFTYKAVNGWVLGYFTSEQIAKQVDQLLDVSLEGSACFTLNAEQTGGAISITLLSGENLTFSFLVKDPKDITLYTTQRRKRKADTQNDLNE